MSSVRKITIIPALNLKENQHGGGSNENIIIEATPNVIKSKAKRVDNRISIIGDKMDRYFKIILKLAKKYGYDEELHIKTKNGNYLANTNIIELLKHAMSTSKIIYGEQEFIELLKEANISPELIINENVKLKLNKHINNQSDIRDYIQKTDTPSDNELNSSNRLLNSKNKPGENRSDYELTDVIDSNKQVRHKRTRDEFESDIVGSHSKKKLIDIKDDQVNKELWEIP